MCNPHPNSAPTAQPMNSVGVKTPPTAPEPTVADVASTFAASTASSHSPTSSPLRIVPTTLYPLPQTCGTTIEIPRGAERIIAIGSAMSDAETADAGLAGWYAGMQLPYVGWSSAVAPGCVVHSTISAVRLHRERVAAGWITGAELAAGVTTVTTTFSEPTTTVVIVLDDPAAFGDPTAGRQLLLGLDGAERARDAAGRERAPVLLSMENRSVLAYDIVPGRERPVVVTIASEEGWSLVGVMGSTTLDATGAIALISARGLDAAIRPLAGAADPTAESRLEWRGPTRTPEERVAARALASRRPPMQAVLAPKRARKATKKTAKKAIRKTAKKATRKTSKKAAKKRARKTAARKRGNR